MNIHTKLPNLYLLGFMGSGKSTVGQRVAELLYMRFLDGDIEISKKMGMSIAKVVENYGESYFRKLEQAFIESEHPAEGCVVACGGGILTSDGMLEQLERKGVLICLLASAETLLKRTEEDYINIRPLLNGASNRLERIKELLTKRISLYNAVRLKIVTDDKAVDEVVGEALEYYRSAICLKET